MTYDGRLRFAKPYFDTVYVPGEIKAMAVIRSGEDTGTIRLTAWADEAEEASIEIEVE